MSHHISLETVDADGAIREAGEAAGIDRRDLLRKGAITSAGFVAGGVLFNGFASPAAAAISSRRPSKKNDVKILNYALTLEFLEAEFYKQALANNIAANEPTTLKFNQVVAEHEAAHVKFLRGALGKAAIKKPSFDFADAVTDLGKFKATAQVLEDVGVSAYAGQGPNISQRAVVQAALSVHSVEARHAAWIRFINNNPTGATADGSLPAPSDFDKARSERQVLKLATPFIA